jgi:hypothetical protein
MASKDAAGRRELKMISGLTFSSLAAQFTSNDRLIGPVPVSMPIRTKSGTVLPGEFTDDARTQPVRLDGAARRAACSLAKRPECVWDQ